MCLTQESSPLEDSNRPSNVEAPEDDEFYDSDNENYEVYQSDFESEDEPTLPPTILSMSWRSCPANGGLELFLIGRNFSRDSKVIFDEGPEPTSWRVIVDVDRDDLNQCHLICVVPPYKRTDIQSPVGVRLFVECGDFTSDSHMFAYTPVIGYLPTSPVVRFHPQPTGNPFHVPPPVTFGQVVLAIEALALRNNGNNDNSDIDDDNSDNGQSYL